MFRRMGELLVEYGELSAADLEAILVEQKTKYRPFGQIAAQRCGVPTGAVWRAWAEQYARYCPRVHVTKEKRDPAVAGSLMPMQAWVFRLLPLRRHDGDLVLVTSPSRLPMALQFADESLPRESVVIWLCHESTQALEDCIKAAYPGCERQVA